MYGKSGKRELDKGKGLTVIIVPEERIQPRAVDGNVLRIEYAQPPARTLASALLAGRRERRVVDLKVRGEGRRGRGIGLVVGALGLYLPGEEGASVGKLVLVEGVVFGGCADAGGLDVLVRGSRSGVVEEEWEGERERGRRRTAILARRPACLNLGRCRR